MTVTPDPGDDPLTHNIRRLADRVTLAESIIQRLRKVVIVLGVLVVAFVVMTVILGSLFIESRRQYDDIVATRTESRMATCHSDNTFIANHNALVDAVEQAAALVNQPNPSRTPEQQAAVDRFVANYTATVEHSRVALRDCSPEAIAAFYKHPGG